MSKESETELLAGALGKTTEPTLELKGRTISIEPLQIDQILQLMLLINSLAEKGVALPSSGKGTNWTELVLTGGDDFKKFLAIAANPDHSAIPDEIAFIGKLNVLELAKFAGLVWKVNKDFFVENQIEILHAFGLDENDLAEIKKLVASIRSLATSALPASPTSDSSPSENASQSVGA